MRGFKECEEDGIFESLGSPVRRAILRTLATAGAPRRNAELMVSIGKRQQAVSHHMAILRLRRLVEYTREGKSNHYRLTAAGRRAIAMMGAVEVGAG